MAEGWTCPICKRGVAPAIALCPCQGGHVVYSPVITHGRVVLDHQTPQVERHTVSVSIPPVPNAQDFVTGIGAAIRQRVGDQASEATAQLKAMQTDVQRQVKMITKPRGKPSTKSRKPKR